MEEMNKDTIRDSESNKNEIMQDNDQSGLQQNIDLNDTQNVKEPLPEYREETTSLHNILQQNKQNDIYHDDERSFSKRFRGSFLWSIIRFLICIVIIAVGVFFILYIIARAAKYDSISSMLQNMLIELELMWQRVIY